jgi:glutamate racemase
MINYNSPIGFFDSGVGGTSIWKEMNQLLPHENTIYLADSANAPYGKKTKEEIISLSEKNTKFLIDKGCKVIVVACNTATTNAIDHLRNKYRIPFIGIEPAIKPAAIKSNTKSIGILATQGTLSSELFAKTSKIHAKDVKVVEQTGKGLVELVESNQIQTKKMQDLLLKYLTPMLAENIDFLILGCTHYPYLIPEIKKITGKNVKILDSGFAVSKQIKNVLTQRDLLNKQTQKGQHTFYTNVAIDVLQNIIKDNKAIIKIEKINF